MVVLAEYNAEWNDLCDKLKNYGTPIHKYPSGVDSRLTVLATIDNVAAKDQTKYESIQLLDDDLILCCIHLPSQIYTRGSAMRRSAVRRIIGDIQRNEKEHNTKNTIVVGDFNVNPYDEECMGFEYFYGLPFISDGRTSREIADERYEFFYNPMWNFLGDFQEPYGTYYSSGSDTFWNILDQVIVRPELKQRFKNSELKILARTTKTCLINADGSPNKKISDHLPLVFEVEDNRE